MLVGVAFLPLLFPPSGKIGILHYKRVKLRKHMRQIHVPLSSCFQPFQFIACPCLRTSIKYALWQDVSANTSIQIGSQYIHVCTYRIYSETFFSKGVSWDMPMVLRRPSRVCWQIGKTPGAVSYKQWFKNSFLPDILLYIMYSKISGRKKVFKSLFLFPVFNRISQSCDRKYAVENANYIALFWRPFWKNRTIFRLCIPNRIKWRPPVY